MVVFGEAEFRHRETLDLNQRLAHLTIVVLKRMRLAATKRWKPQTFQRHAANLQGAFADLPLYSNSAFSVNLSTDAEWKAPNSAALFSSQVVAQAAVFFIAIVILRFRPLGLVGSR